MKIKIIYSNIYDYYHYKNSRQRIIFILFYTKYLGHSFFHIDEHSQPGS